MVSAANVIKLLSLLCQNNLLIMSFKSKKNKYLRKIAQYLLQHDTDSVGKNEFSDMTIFLKTDSPIIFDVGANIGQSILKFRSYFPGGSIFSFEPSLDTFNQLSTNTSHLDAVHLFNIALGSSKQKKAFHENSSSVMSSFLEIDQIGDKVITGNVLVDVERLDEYCTTKIKNVSNIDILKIDAQGYDFEVLKGAQELFDQNKIGMVYLELIFGKMYKGQPIVSDILQFLIENRFKLVSFYDFHYHDNLATWTDGLFVHESLVNV
jgi:FkbM family methyltransferase